MADSALKGEPDSEMMKLVDAHMQAHHKTAAERDGLKTRCEALEKQLVELREIGAVVEALFDQPLLVSSERKQTA